MDHIRNRNIFHPTHVFARFIILKKGFTKGVPPRIKGWFQIKPLLTLFIIGTIINNIILGVEYLNGTLVHVVINKRSKILFNNPTKILKRRVPPKLDNPSAWIKHPYRFVGFRQFFPGHLKRRSRNVADNITIHNAPI